MSLRATSMDDRAAMGGTPVGEIGIDTGGTFTDVVCRLADDRIRIAKVPSTRADPSRAMLQAVSTMLEHTGLSPDGLRRVVHGTTVATNAIIERTGARLGLITTAGFRDVLEIGRQMRRQLYELELEPQTPVFLAPRHLRREVRERLSATGEVVIALNEDDVLLAADELVAEGVQAIAVVFLFSYLNAAHERRVRDLIHDRHPGIAVSISCEVDPAAREYERSVVTAFDGYLKPVVDRYLGNVEDGLKRLGVEGPFQVMQSRGGLSSGTAARSRPVRLVLSGPAAGVVGAQLVGRMSGVEDLITVDVGGTSSDIALISRGKPIVRTEGEVDGYPVRIPMVDVNAIGAGGGSVAWLDGAGGLRVGPHSAGADPGPACYGRGGEVATVTDASVVLGWVNPDYFAGGTLRLRKELAVDIVRRTVADPLGTDVEKAALGIHRVVNNQMAEGIRLVSVRQGYDPRRFALVPVGGAGPVHATQLASILGIRRILVPRFPGVMAATGLLAAPVEYEATTAVGVPLVDMRWADAAATLAGLDGACRDAMSREAIDDRPVQVTHFADLSYAGQASHLEVPIDAADGDPLDALERRFSTLYAQVFGQATEMPVQLVALRAVHSAGFGSTFAFDGDGEAKPARKGTRRIVLPGGATAEVPVFDRDGLPPGFSFVGPAVVEQVDTTVLVESGWRCRVTAGGVLSMDRTDAGERIAQ